MDLARESVKDYYFGVVPASVMGYYSTREIDVTFMAGISQFENDLNSQSPKENLEAARIRGKLGCMQSKLDDTKKKAFKSFKSKKKEFIYYYRNCRTACLEWGGRPQFDFGKPNYESMFISLVFTFQVRNYFEPA